MSVNKVILVGNIGQEPEVKQISDTFKVAKMSLATSETFKDKNGEKTTKTEWHNLLAHNKTAELFEKYVHKGDMLYVEGKIQTRSWEKDGNKFYATEVIVMNVTFLKRAEKVQEQNQHQNTIDISKEPNGIDKDDSLPF